MKSILIASCAALALFSSSCRTFVPVDPNIGKPSCSMMPCKASASSCSMACSPCSKCPVSGSK